MIAAGLLLCLGPSLGQSADFERSLEATAEGRYSDALLYAESNDLDPVSRSQARFWALYRSGLLDLALAEAEAGLAASPHDEWLLPQAVEVALSLHDGRTARRYLASLEASNATPSSDLRRRVGARVSSEELAAAGLRRAIGVACGLLALCAGLFAWGLRGPR